MSPFKAALTGAAYALAACIFLVGLGTCIDVAIRVLPAVCK